MFGEGAKHVSSFVQVFGNLFLGLGWFADVRPLSGRLLRSSV